MTIITDQARALVLCQEVLALLGKGAIETLGLLSLSPHLGSEKAEHAPQNSQVQTGRLIYHHGLKRCLLSCPHHPLALGVLSLCI